MLFSFTPLIFKILLYFNYSKKYLEKQVNCQEVKGEPVLLG